MATQKVDHSILKRVHRFDSPGNERVIELPGGRVVIELVAS